MFFSNFLVKQRYKTFKKKIFWAMSINLTSDQNNQ